MSEEGDPKLSRFLCGMVERNAVRRSAETTGRGSQLKKDGKQISHGRRDRQIAVFGVPGTT